MFDKIVIVTKKTQVEELTKQFNQVLQAKFYIENSGQSFETYEKAHDSYYYSAERIREIIPSDIKYQYIDREFLPNFLFGDKDLVITLGPDGLVINTGKYLNAQPILAINPDPLRIDGVLIPFSIEDAKRKIDKILSGSYNCTNISMAKATLNDGQTIYGVNDLFIGASSHVSFRYKIKHGKKLENQSSSGIIVSTGAGSTGWLKSVLTGANGIWHSYSGKAQPSLNKKQIKTAEQIQIQSNQNNNDIQNQVFDAIGTRFEIDPSFPWDAKKLCFSIREPFPSKVSKANILFGDILEGEKLVIESNMPTGGIIFSDGIENDFLEFNSGKTAEIALAEKYTRLITGV